MVVTINYLLVEEVDGRRACLGVYHGSEAATLAEVFEGEGVTVLESLLLNLEEENAEGTPWEYTFEERTQYIGVPPCTNSLADYLAIVWCV
jgi:hypothetical protein